MSSIRVKFTNPKTQAVTSETIERMEDGQWDRWLQLGLVIEIKLSDEDVVMAQVNSTVCRCWQCSR